MANLLTPIHFQIHPNYKIIYPQRMIKIARKKYFLKKKPTQSSRSNDWKKLLSSRKKLYIKDLFSIDRSVQWLCMVDEMINETEWKGKILIKKTWEFKKLRESFYWASFCSLSLSLNLFLIPFISSNFIFISQNFDDNSKA